MGLVNRIVAPEKLEEEVEKVCDTLLSHSPTALAALKTSFNADTESIWGIHSMAGVALNLYYGTDEAMEGRNAFMEKRKPDFAKFRKCDWVRLGTVLLSHSCDWGRFSCRNQALNITSLLMPISLDSSRTDTPVLTFISLISSFRTFLSLQLLKFSRLYPLFPSNSLIVSSDFFF